MRFPLPISSRPLRRAIAFLTLTCFLLASLGLLPSPAWIWSRLPSRQDYPCAGHGCGCASLDHCWSACNCFSRPQRLAWSITHRAPIPGSARPTDEEWQLAGAIAAGLTAPDAPPCPLCHVEAPPEPDSAGPASATLSALGCQGAFPWITLPAIPADPRGPGLLIIEQPASPAVALAAELIPGSRTLEAPTPPPRAA
ncbi:MAG: hypothetical protein IT436_01570 [Phycisphaerales bacterium]|nr:hypothetical protein [Phycisphaerales bacterium]